MASVTSTTVSDKATKISSSAITDLLDTASTAAEDYANSTAYTTQAEGDTAEADAYQKSSDLDTANVSLAGLSAALKQADEARTLTKTLGTQAADVAGAGLGSGGTAAWLLRDSARQGAFEQQQTGYEGTLTQRDYTNQAAAEQAQADTSTKAASSATDTAKTYSSAASTSKTNALNDAYALLQNASPTDKNYGLVGSIKSQVGDISADNASSAVSISSKEYSNLNASEDATGEGDLSTAAGGSTTDTADTSTETSRDDELASLRYGKSDVTSGITTIGNKV